MVTEFVATKENKQKKSSGKSGKDQGFPAKKNEPRLKDIGSMFENTGKKIIAVEDIHEKVPPPEAPKRRGRPKGSKNIAKNIASAENTPETKHTVETKPKHRGRPKGSKNRAKAGTSADETKQIRRRGRKPCRRAGRKTVGPRAGKSSQYILVTPKGRGLSVIPLNNKGQAKKAINQQLADGKSPASIALYKREDFKIEVRAIVKI
jgi:hypothetical protein